METKYPEKLLIEDRERAFYLVKEWITKAGLKAMVVKCKWKIAMPSSLLHDHHNGYVEMKKALPDQVMESLSVHGGITFHGAFSPDMKIEGNWIGFDFAHYGDENIKDQEAYAEKECEDLAIQLKEQSL